MVRVGDLTEADLARTVRVPDPFIPGGFFTIRNPRTVLGGCSRVGCPICEKLLNDIVAARPSGFVLVA